MEILTDKDGNKFEVLDIRSSRQPNQFIYTMRPLPPPAKTIVEELRERRNGFIESDDVLYLCKILDRRLKELEEK